MFFSLLFEIEPNTSIAFSMFQLILKCSSRLGCIMKLVFLLPFSKVLVRWHRYYLWSLMTLSEYEFLWKSWKVMLSHSKTKNRITKFDPESDWNLMFEFLFYFYSFFWIKLLYYPVNWAGEHWIECITLSKSLTLSVKSGQIIIIRTASNLLIMKCLQATIVALLINSKHFSSVRIRIKEVRSKIKCPST